MMLQAITLAAMYKDINPLGVRFPAELKEKIEKSAARNHRSLNAEIVARMIEAYEKSSAVRDYTDGELIDELIRRWGREAVYIQLGKRPEP
jgi:hypothetical protein